MHKMILTSISANLYNYINHQKAILKKRELKRNKRMRRRITNYHVSELIYRRLER